jgi:5-methylcytosine-specific restriction endonuclease McrA
MIRSQVRERARRRCEYCLYPDLIRSRPFAVEHIQPRSAGGSDEQDNLAWSCDHCIGKTPTGRATISRLQLNRESTLEARRLSILGGLHPPIH